MTMEPRRIGILGAGGLGRSAVRLLAQKEQFRLVAIADSMGFAADPNGIGEELLEHVPAGETVAKAPRIGRPSADPVADMIAANRAGAVDAIFLAIPNIPNDALPSTIERLCREGFRGVAVDAMKRTSAVEAVLHHADLLRESGITYVTGAGATPGLLTAAAALAAQSFATVEAVDIHFGVGIANWESYRATVREDIAHMPGFNIDKVRVMSDAEVEALLDERNGLLELHNMEHADDILLERAGVVSRERVTVGGLVDTRNPKKPVSTRMALTGTTFEGKRATHTFTLGDETSMAANVLGPAFGWMNAALDLHARGIHGLFSSADLMPKSVR